MDKRLKDMMKQCNQEKLASFKETFDKVMTGKIRVMVKQNLFESNCKEQVEDLKKGDHVYFNWETRDGMTFDDPMDWGFETEDEVNDLRDRDGETAMINGEATDGYYDITFDDGYKLSAVSGAHLESMMDESIDKDEEASICDDCGGEIQGNKCRDCGMTVDQGQEIDGAEYQQGDR